MGETRRFMHAVDAMRVLLRVSSPEPQLMALRRVHWLRLRSRFRAVREEMLRLLWDTRLLHDDYEHAITVERSDWLELPRGTLGWSTASLGALALPNVQYMTK